MSAAGGTSFRLRHCSPGSKLYGEGRGEGGDGQELVFGFEDLCQGPCGE